MPDVYRERQVTVGSQRRECIKCGDTLHVVTVYQEFHDPFGSVCKEMEVTMVCVLCGVEVTRKVKG